MRIAVLGLGFMGSTHVKAIQSLSDVELAGIYSSDERKLSGDLTGVQGNLGGPGEKLDFSQVRKYRDIEPLFADPAIEAVDICLPTDLHEWAATEALRAGKHVLVEKPMALDAFGAARMVSAARRAIRVLMTGHVLRFFPEYTALREAVKNGGLGRMRFAIFRRRCAAPSWGGWLLDPERSGGGVFDLLIHDVDMCLHLFGRPEALSASGCADLEAGVDTISAQLIYGGGSVVEISGGWYPPGEYPFSMEYSVALDGGSIEYNSIDRPPVLYPRKGPVHPLPMESGDAYAAEIDYFAACCRDECAPLRCPPAESALAVKLMALLLDSRNRKGVKMVCNL
jgi:predicted dehydrogenase